MTSNFGFALPFLALFLSLDADTARSWNDKGATHFDQGRLQAAERAYREAIGIWKRLPDRSDNLAVTLANLSAVRKAQGNPTEAMNLLLDARQILTEANRLGSGEMAFVVWGIAEMHYDLGQHEESRRAAMQTLSILDQLGGQEVVRRGAVELLLAKLEWGRGRAEEAESHVRRALDTWKGSPSKAKDATYYSGLVCLAEILSSKNPIEAHRLYSEALPNLEGHLGSEHPYIGYVLNQFSRLLFSTGQKREARILKRRADGITKGHSKENNLGMVVDIKTLQGRSVR